MKAGIRFLRIDLTIQKILGFIYLTLGLLGIAINSALMFALLTQLVIGIWQVVSAFTITMFNRDRKRLPYILSVVSYFMILFFSFLILENLEIKGGIPLIVFGIVILPMSLAVWYYWITYKNYEFLLKNSTQDEELIHDMEDVLDSGEWEN